MALASSMPEDRTCFSRSRPLSLIAITKNSCRASSESRSPSGANGTGLAAFSPADGVGAVGKTVPMESTGSFSLPFFLSQACQALTRGLGYGPWQMAT